VLDLDQRQACDGIEVLDPGDPRADGGAAAPWRGRLDAIGAVAPEPEVRQRLGQAGQRGVEKVVAQHTVGDQRRGEVPEGGGEDPGRIGQVRGRRRSLRPAGRHTGRLRGAGARSRS